MSDPKRREVRRTHLDASAVPVERALLARAEIAGSELHVVREAARFHGVTDEVLIQVVGDAVSVIIANEFRALAEELHWH